MKNVRNFLIFLFSFFLSWQECDIKGNELVKSAQVLILEVTACYRSYMILSGTYP